VAAVGVLCVVEVAAGGDEGVEGMREEEGSEDGEEG